MTQEIKALTEEMVLLLDGVLRNLSDAITVVDEHGGYVYANEMAAAMCGYDSLEEFMAAGSAETLSRFELLDEGGNPLDLSNLPGRRALRGDSSSATQLVQYRVRETGEARWSRLRSSGFRDPKLKGRLAVNVFQDVTDEVRAARARQFVVEASGLLASSLDYDTTLASLAHLAVPRIADWCSIEMIQEDGGVRQVAVAHFDPKKVSLAKELGRRFPYDPRALHGTAHVIRTGEPELISEIPDEMLIQASPDPELVQVLRDLALRSSLCVPLIARGRTLGVITLVSTESGRQFDERDLALAQDLASRAAMAVDNARLFGESQRSNAQLTAVLTQMADAVAIASADGKIAFENEAVRSIFGGSRIGGSVTSLGPEAQALTLEGEGIPGDDLPLTRALRGDRLVGMRWRLKRHGDIERFLDSSSVPIRDESGRVIGGVAVYRDITDQRDLERQKYAFLLAASHDLKNPLTLVKGVAQLLTQQLSRGRDSDQVVLEGLRRIDATANQMADLINELLDITRLRMGQELSLEREEVDLVEVVERCVQEILASSSKHQIQIMTGSPRLVGMWDAARLQRVVSNLLSNAVKFSPRDGGIEVHLRAERVNDEDGAVISVRDHGIGIPEADVNNIFDAFHRGGNVEGRVPGSGIGLAGVKQILEEHGGEIKVESRENEGSTFTVWLPLKDQRCKERDEES